MLSLTRTTLCCLTLVTFTITSQAAESIAYRLSESKQLHFDDASKAEQHLAAVKKLGCEASMNSRRGHTDVAYRSATWQVMEVANDKLAHQWEDWLKKAGFETIHGHSAGHSTEHSADDGHDHSGHDHAKHSHAGHNHAPGEAEQIAYQLPQWKTIHVKDQQQVPELVALMKGLGCEVRSEMHGEHADLSIRCAAWKHIQFSSHQAAATWEEWLKSYGFATRHEH